MSSQWGHLKPENNFQKACVEFVESERSYVDSLGEMSMTYYWPLMSCFGGTVVKMPSPCPSFTAEHGKVLFGNLEHIVHVSQQFLEKMRKDGAAAILSGEALRTQMTELIPLLKIYIDYCSGFAASSVLLAKLIHDHADFKAFESQCQRKTNNNLGFYLIMPVQRVPRYKLLLATLITEAEKHNAESKNGVAPRVLEAFQEAFHKVSNVANQINEQLREQENALEISTLAESFVEDPGFAKVGRSLLKRENVTYQKQPCLLVLFNDHVALATRQQAIKALSGVSFSSGLQPLQTRYKLVNQMSLDHAFKLTMDSTDPKVFTIISSQKYWVVEFETAEKRSEWQKALEDSKTKKISRPRGSRLVSLSVPHRPVLKPKASAVVCGLCKSRFNMVFKRAKNCKLCGELFCTECSLSRVQQPPNPKLVRACDSCASRILIEGEHKGQNAMFEGVRASSPSPQRGRIGSSLRDRTQSEPPNSNRNGISSTAAAFSPPLPLPIPRVRSATANYSTSTGTVHATPSPSPLSPITRANPPSVFVAPLFSLIDETQVSSPANVLRPAVPTTLRAASAPYSSPPHLPTSPVSTPLSPSLSAASSPHSAFRSISPSPRTPDSFRTERSISQSDVHIRTVSPPPRSPPIAPPRPASSSSSSSSADRTSFSPASRPLEHTSSSRTPSHLVLSPSSAASSHENNPHQFVSSSSSSSSHSEAPSTSSSRTHDPHKPPSLPSSPPPSAANSSSSTTTSSAAPDTGPHQFVASRPAEGVVATRQVLETSSHNKPPALPLGLPPSGDKTAATHHNSNPHRVQEHVTSPKPLHEFGAVHKPPALPSGSHPTSSSSSSSSDNNNSNSGHPSVVSPPRMETVSSSSPGRSFHEQQQQQHKPTPFHTENHATVTKPSVSSVGTSHRMLPPSSFLPPPTNSSNLPPSSQRSASAAPSSKISPAITSAYGGGGGASFRSLSPSPAPVLKPGSQPSSPTPPSSSSSSAGVVASAKMIEQKLGSGLPVRTRAQSADFVRPSHKHS